MDNESRVNASREQPYETMSGWTVLPVHVITLISAVVMLVFTIIYGVRLPLLALGVVTVIACFITLFGYFTLQPNESRVLIFFGDYKGTERRSGFH